MKYICLMLNSKNIQKQKSGYYVIYAIHFWNLKYDFFFNWLVIHKLVTHKF